MSPRASVCRGPQPPVLGHRPVDLARDFTLVLPAWAASAVARNIADPGRAREKLSAVGWQQGPPSTPPPKRALIYWRPVAAAGTLTAALLLALVVAIHAAGPSPKPGSQAKVPLRPDSSTPERPPLASLPEHCPAEGGSPRGSFGTGVAFVGTPAEAFRQAEKHRKLTFLLHVSGNFEESCFT
jgi:hypothetical protein